MLDTSRRTAFTESHDLFREQVRKFFDKERASCTRRPSRPNSTPRP